MQNAHLPPQENDRLQALRDLLVLDTPPEERFDRIVEFAAGEFDMPIVLLSLVDEKRQWFKARIGLDACETDRNISFCAHAILQDKIMLVADVAQDERFFDNPMVTGVPNIQFYAGAQLKLPGGESIGTLCLIDRVPRQLDEIDLAILASLRDLALEELLRRSGGATP